MISDFFNTLSADLQQELLQKCPENYSSSDFYEVCTQHLSSLSHLHPEYDHYALLFSLEQHEKNTQSGFVPTVKRIQANRDLMGGLKPLYDLEFYDFILSREDAVEKLFQQLCGEKNQFDLTYFGWKTLCRAYLIKTHEGVQERLDHLWFRISLYFHRDNDEKVKKSFRMLRSGSAIHATPTLYHAGLQNPQMASCFLVGTDDSVAGIYKTIGDAAMISKYAGGLGIHISNIRGKNSYIHGTNGISNGIMPMLRVYNDTSRYIDQCFEGMTPIVTSRGVIPIKDIVPFADSVLTNDGTFQMVKKKLVHGVSKDICSVKIQTPWKDIVSTTMTSLHDMLWKGTGLGSCGSYMSLEKAHFGARTVYRDSPSVGIAFWEEECAVLGFLYGAISVNNNNGICEFSISKRHALLELMEEMLRKFFGNGSLLVEENSEETLFKYKLNLMCANISTSSPLLLDMDVLMAKDVPQEFCMAPIGKLKRFYDAYSQVLLDRNQSSEFTQRLQTPRARWMRYRLGIQTMNTSEDVAMEGGKFLSLERQSDLCSVKFLYDLEVNKNHNYQTLLGIAHNGGGKRKGAFAMYLEPWHSDIMDFVQARRNTGNEEERARDLFYGLWMPDYFMRQVEKDGGWHLMSEIQSPGLTRVWGKDFDDLYERYIAEGRFVKEIKARDLWVEILKSQIETGTPYILYKDAANRYSNQKNLGTIQSSNLCCEIIEYSDHKEYAVCNLASISLPSCIQYPEVEEGIHNFWIYGKKDCIYCKLITSILTRRGIAFEYVSKEDAENNNNPLTAQQENWVRGKSRYPMVFNKGVYVGGFTETWTIFLKPRFDFNKLGDLVETLVENLNIVIDKNCYPLEECRRSNMKNRPIGMGVQGLADVFMEMLEPFDSEFSRKLNQKIFERIYYHGLKKSHELAQVNGPYQSFQGSPLSKGILHFDQYEDFSPENLSSELNWTDLRENIRRDGVRNSLLVAPMPTASTSQILGNTESFEPLTSNMYLRRTLAGEFYVVNKSLRRVLMDMNMWGEKIITNLILNKGSVSQMEISNQLKEVYRTVWEIPQKSLIDMAADRQRFIDQSQSFNIYMAKPDMNVLTKIHFYGWKKQLKTGCYYLRTRSVTSSQSFTIDPTIEKNSGGGGSECESCSG